MTTKLFTIVAIAAIPLLNKFSKTDLNVSNTAVKRAYVFPYKNILTTNFWETGKKTSQTWSQNWMSQAQENIRRSEYHFNWEEKYKAYCTPNRKNNLRFFYTDKGFSVEPRTTKIPIGDFDPMARPDEIKYKSIPNWKIKFNLDKKQMGKGSWTVTENKAEYIADNITVQYINNDEGMRQNFIVQSPLHGNKELKINFSVLTNLKTRLYGNQLQFFQHNKNVLNYDRLKVWDANGKPLNASIRLRSNYGGQVKKTNINNFYIQVNTKNAVYPITIDLLTTTPNWMGESNQADSYFGVSVSSAGDINGDGYSDVIIGAEEYDNGETSEGKAYVYHGSATGLSISPNWGVESNQAFALFGNSVSSAGDVNRDGYSDVIVGAYGYDNGELGEGAAFVYHGSASGLNASAATVLETNLANALGGYSVSCAGDVNADGYSDVIVGVRWYTNGEAQEGGGFIYHGSSTGIINSVVSIIETNQPGPNGGFSVSSAGDINGDGYSDVIVGAPGYDNGQTNEGVALICYGSVSGVNTTLVIILETNQANAEGGQSVSSAGDVNGDGYSDVIIGAPHYTNGELDEGAAFVFQGSASGINVTPVLVLESDKATANAGWSVASSGDVNADGYGDIIVGVLRYYNGQGAEGAAFVYQGSATGLNSTSVVKLETNQDNAFGGWSVSSAGDINGDGYSDVIVGAPLYTSGETNEGVAFVYHGSAAGLSSLPNNTPDDANQANAFFGWSVASAGDINGDGYSDVIIGATGYDAQASNEGRAFIYHGSAAGLSATPNVLLDDADQFAAAFGWSVACAGDVNGDGFSDVIVGARNYDDAPFTNEGRVYVHHGSSTGLSTSPNSILDDADKANAFFGSSVASAGDVNGDGYSDVIVGAYSYDDGANLAEGNAFVYYGSSTGLSASPNSILDDANQPNAWFGSSVASAGDVNGDGFSDVIVGAREYLDGPYSGEGRAFVYHGSSTGLSANPNSLLDDADQTNAWFGSSVAGAGDVNGDGYSDVIIGAPGFDDIVNTDEGRAFVYYGSSSGLSTTPSSILDDADLANAQFGTSVMGAGDINGDGYSDVLIGAPTFDDGINIAEGRAFVYHGSTTGIASIPNSTPDDANFTNVHFGFSVAGAGDINGDGYSDVIIGGPDYIGTFFQEGRAFIYHGNDSTSNRRNNLRMYNTDLTTPLDSTNFVKGNFGAGLFAKSFLGKVKGKMVWETRINYNAYSGNPITNSTLYTAQQSAYTELGLAGKELKNVINKLLGSGIYTKLRARVKYDPVTAITGQVYGPWRNVSAVIDGNSLGALPVELVSFDAAWMQKGKTAKITFTTDKESGICCFDIEKSLDGFNFHSIGSLPARNTAGIQSYSFIDNNASSKKQFYRLMIKGDNAKVEYSNIQQLQNSGTIEILVFPNPATDFLKLQLNGVFDKMNVQIVNSGGQIVKQLNNLAVAGQTITIPVNNLAPGQYWLRLQNGSEKQVLQFVKQ